MASEGRAQAAWMVMATDKDLSAGISAKVSVIAWRSSRLRRVVASTLAGETLALTQGVAELGNNASDSSAGSHKRTAPDGRIERPEGYACESPEAQAAGKHHSTTDLLKQLDVDARRVHRLRDGRGQLVNPLLLVPDQNVAIPSIPKVDDGPQWARQR